MEKQEGDSIETYLKKMVDDAIDEREIKLKEEDAKEIIEAILPEIEKIVSNVVIKHLKALASYMQENLKDPKEK